MADRARFEQLFREHYGAIAAFCFRRLDDEDAADVVADVFTTTWDRLDDVDEAQTRPWLYAVARNKIAQRWRANGRRSDAAHRLAVLPRFASIGCVVVSKKVSKRCNRATATGMTGSNNRPRSIDWRNDDRPA